MQRLSRQTLLFVLPLVSLLNVERLQAGDVPEIRSRKSGAWSAEETWDLGRVPKTGDRVFVAPGHHVVYDIDSAEVIRLVQIAGTLEFSRDRDTKLEAGLIKVVDSDDLCEAGFDCHMQAKVPSVGKPRPALLVGTPESPIPRNHRATIRLHYVAGMDKESCPAIVCCSGRMEFHGAPLPHTWSKLSQRGVKGHDHVWMADSPEGWQKGDQIIVTSTIRRKDHKEQSQTEMRRIVAVGEPVAAGASAEVSDASYGDYSLANTESAGTANPGAHLAKLALPPGARDPVSNGFNLRIDKPLEFDHDGQGVFHGEVANLSRNVVVESADPQGVRGHTMYHKYSQGSISYAEFRHLGKEGVLGRYSIHFHLVEDTMRGSYVKGASIWDSRNRWVVVHGTDYLVVRDCVGYKSIGHGFFMEDGSEVFNVFDHNLAVQATAGKPLPKQVFSFDLNRGAGFWWANCHNAISNNVAADCDEYGFRFDVKRAADFDPVMPILQADGSKKKEDVRSLPFIKFSDNEAHSIMNFGMSLRGFPLNDGSGKFHNDINAVLYKEVRESSPDQRYPFWIHNFRAWETGLGYNAGVGGVFIDGLDIRRSTYGMWRVVLDRNVWRGVKMDEIANKELHMPFSVGPPQGDGEGVPSQPYFLAIQGFVDDEPPSTIITKIVRVKDEVLVCGSSTDTSEIRHVLVNGRRAYSTRDNFAEWEVVFGVPSDKDFAVAAYAEDVLGNVEPRAHRAVVPALAAATQLAQKK
jgi:hypothetical protein